MNSDGEIEIGHPIHDVGAEETVASLTVIEQQIIDQAEKGGMVPLKGNL